MFCAILQIVIINSVQNRKKMNCLKVLENDPNQAETRGDLTLERREPHKAISIYAAFHARAISSLCGVLGHFRESSSRKLQSYWLEDSKDECWTCQSGWKLKRGGGESQKERNLSEKSPHSSPWLTLKPWNSGWDSKKPTGKTIAGILRKRDFFFFFLKWP